MIWSTMPGRPRRPAPLLTTITLVLTLVGAATFAPMPRAATATVPEDALLRLVGPSRIETAVAISRRMWPSSQTVVVARSDDYPDALAGAPLAVAHGAPILLTSPEALHPAVEVEVARLGATHAVVLGGEAAVSPAVEAQLRAAGLTVERVAGSSRFATAAAIAAAVGPSDRAFLVEGANVDPARGWPDALAVAPVAARLRAPILLTTRDVLPRETIGALSQLGVRRVTIVGGEAAVGSRVASRLRRRGYEVERVWGPDRYATALAIAAAGVADGAGDPGSTVLATGLDFPDSLAAGAAVAMNGGQLLLVHGSDPAASQVTLDELAATSDARRSVLLLGGAAAISHLTAHAVRDALGDGRRLVTEQPWMPLATVGGVVLVHPSARVERVGFHQSSNDAARDLGVLPSAVDPLVLDSRGRGTGSRTAADVMADPDVEVRAPVSGVVVRAGTYVLYCDNYDDYAVIEPDSHPGWEVKVLHIDGVMVSAGDRVVAGETVLAPRPTRLPFESQVEETSARPPWPHVHVEVVDPTIPDRPSGGC